jgi:hypothetical protein
LTLKSSFFITHVARVDGGRLCAAKFSFFKQAKEAKAHRTSHLMPTVASHRPNISPSSPGMFAAPLKTSVSSVACRLPLVSTIADVETKAKVALDFKLIEVSYTSYRCWLGYYSRI